MKKLLIVMNHEKNYVDNIPILDNICKKIDNYFDNMNRVVFINWNQMFNESNDFNIIKNKDFYNDIEFYGLEKMTSSSLNSIIDGNYDQIEFCGSLIDVDILMASIIVKNIKTKTQIVIDSNSCIATNMDLHFKTLDIMKNLNMTIY